MSASASVQRTALVMAGGTGGHIFPGLAVAQLLRDRGWRVHWLGAPDSMESRLVPARGFTLETIAFSGVRGKGLKTLALLPLRLLRALSRRAPKCCAGSDPTSCWGLVATSACPLA